MTISGITLFQVSYSSENVVEGKKAAKEALQQKLGLKRADLPLVGIITRLTHQKGIHLIKHAIWRTLERGGQVFLFFCFTKVYTSSAIVAFIIAIWASKVIYILTVVFVIIYLTTDAVLNILLLSCWTSVLISLGLKIGGQFLTST